MENRRRDLRIPVVMMIRTTRQGTQKSADALVQDICTHGMGIHTNEVYQKGDRLLIDISLQEGGQGNVQEVISGEVAWVEALQKGNKYSVGIRFEPLNKEKQKLYEQVRWLEQRLNYSQGG